PANAAFDTYLRWYATLVQQAGGDAELGLHLHTYLQAAGLHDIQIEIAQPAGTTGAAKQMSLATLDKIKNALLANNIVTEKESSGVRGQLYDFTAQAESLLSIPRTFQVWGKKL